MGSCQGRAAFRGARCEWPLAWVLHPHRGPVTGTPSPYRGPSHEGSRVTGFQGSVGATGLTAGRGHVYRVVGVVGGACRTRSKACAECCGGSGRVDSFKGWPLPLARGPIHLLFLSYAAWHPTCLSPASPVAALPLPGLASGLAHSASPKGICARVHSGGPQISYGGVMTSPHHIQKLVFLFHCYCQLLKGFPHVI